MSNAFAETTKAMNENPDLATKVMAAGTPAERAEILKAAGVAVPTHADISAAHSSLSDVSGAGATSVTDCVVNAVPAAAAATAAG